MKFLEAPLAKAMAQNGRTGKRGPLLREGLIASRIYNLVRLINRSGDVAYRRRLELARFDWGVLTVLGDLSPISLNGLAEEMERDRGQLSRAVQRLEAKGWVSRTAAGGGHRVSIALTDGGRAAFDELAELARVRNEALTTGIADAELEVFWSVLRKLRVNAEAMLADELVLEGASPSKPERPDQAEPA